MSRFERPRKINIYFNLYALSYIYIYIYMNKQFNVIYIFLVKDASVVWFIAYLHRYVRACMHML